MCYFVEIATGSSGWSPTDRFGQFLRCCHYGVGVELARGSGQPVDRAGHRHRCDDTAVRIENRCRHRGDTGFALGHISACGGYVALWGKEGGSWKELIGTQELWACSDLRKHKIPTGLVDTCYESMKEVPYTG